MSTPDGEQAREDFGGVVAELRRLSSFQTLLAHLSGNMVVVEPDSILVVDPDNSDYDIEVMRLIRVMKNASEYSARLYDYMIAQAAGKDPKISKATAARLAATMRDSLGQMHLLLLGMDATGYSPSSENFDDAGEVAGAEAYLVLKALEQKMRDQDPGAKPDPDKNYALKEIRKAMDLISGVK